MSFNLRMNIDSFFCLCAMILFRPTTRADRACARARTRAHMREFKRAYASITFECYVTEWNSWKKFGKRHYIHFNFLRMERLIELGGTFKFFNWFQCVNSIFFAFLISFATYVIRRFKLKKRLLDMKHNILYFEKSGKCLTFGATSFFKKWSEIQHMEKFWDHY